MSDLSKSQTPYLLLQDSGSKLYPEIVIGFDNCVVWCNNVASELIRKGTNSILARDNLIQFLSSESQESALQTIRAASNTGLCEFYNWGIFMGDKVVSCNGIVKRVDFWAEEKQPVLQVLCNSIASESIIQANERYSIALASLGAGVWDWDIETDSVVFSSDCLAILNLPLDKGGEHFTIHDWFKIICSEELPVIQRLFSVVLTGKLSKFDFEHRIINSEGNHRWVSVRGKPIFNDMKVVVRLVGSITDITAMKARESWLEFNANHDHLTGLPNRQLFMEILSNAINLLGRKPEQINRFAVLFLDVDRLKIINDTLGHQAGDDLIVSIARRLKNVVRAGDTVARLGGDEFTILLQNLENPADATRIARRIAREIEHPIQVKGYSVQISVSIGIAFDFGIHSKPDELIRGADLAMYEAKTSGNRVYQVFDSIMHEQVLQQLQLETSLREDLDKNSIRAWFQPCVDLTTNRIVGFEALARWHVSNSEVCFPNQFMEVAEESGLVVSLGKSILEQAAYFSSQINHNRTITDHYFVSVNLSLREISKPNFVDQFEDVLNRFGVAYSTIVLEIKEDILNHKNITVSKNIKRLNTLGVRLHLDNFGMGSSSIALLKDSPIDVIKIDKSFINNIDNDESAVRIVQAISTLASGMDMGIIASGIETVSQLNNLSRFGSLWGQGYVFSQPLEMDEALKLSDYVYSS